MSLTDRQKQLIEAYLPTPPDPELEDDEYYVMGTDWRVHKVYVRDLLPHEDDTTYGVYEVGSNRRIDAGYGSEWIGFRKASMYDNRQDCKDMTHCMYNDWEHLRELQRQEGLI